MENLGGIIFAAVLALDLLLVTSSRLMHCVRIVAVQGVLLGVLPLAAPGALTGHIGETVFLAVMTLGIKGVLLPALLRRSILVVKVRREIEPYVGYSVSAAIFLAAVGGAFILCAGLPTPRQLVSPLALPAAFSTVFSGLFMIVTRKKAITQTIGFLVFENGICLFGMGLMLHHGLLVELGILLDVFVFVFVMGIAVFHIRRKFQHIDADKLSSLGDMDAVPAEMEADNE